MLTIFVIGVAVALLFEEITGLSPGGIIVPGFLALYISEPPRLLWTIASAFVVYGLVLLAQRHMFLYGRRRFGYSVATGVAVKLVLAEILPMLRMLPYGLFIIGLVIPGLIAETFLRQGPLKTLLAMVSAVAITRLAALAVMGWAP